MRRWLAKLFRWRNPRYMSVEWCEALDVSDARAVEYHGVSIRFPINKLVNDAARFNTKRLRKRA